MVGFTTYAVWVARREIPTVEKGLVGETVPERAEPLSRKPTWSLVLGILVALAGLVVGAQALVSAAVSMARALGVSERVVGLTVVSVVAERRGRRATSLGSVGIRSRRWSALGSAARGVARVLPNRARFRRVAAAWVIT